MLSLVPFLALMQDTDVSENPAVGALGCLGGGIGCVVGILFLFLIPALIFWKVFEKAGQPGWAAIVPIYNLYVLTQIARREILWFILLLIPGVGIVAFILVSIDIARKFGQSQGFGVGMGLLPFIFYPMLGFGSAQYNPNA